MPEWKPAEKLKQPKITEVIVSEELNATTIAEELEAETDVSPISGCETQKTETTNCPVRDDCAPIKSPEPPAVETAKISFLDFPEPPPELGERYNVLELIGSGGMGTVWKVFDKQLNGTFAVKVLKPELLADTTALKRFEREANLASDLTHANIAPIFGPGTDSHGRPFIIMGYVDGESLADILAREGKLSEDRAIDIFTQICEALLHSHSKGIIHRDIKPSNIIISKSDAGNDMVHIVDFGIARCVYDEVTKTQALTKAVDIFGSPRYMSPEQFLGGNITAQSDIYSLGCVFYEMLTGSPPFTDENPVKLILQHLSEAPDLSKIPLKLQLALHSCLEKESEQRQPSIERLLDFIARVDYKGITPASSSKLTHCVNAVSLVLMPGMVHMITSSESHAIPINFFLLLYVWLYVALINRTNAARSADYRLLELNLFLATTAAATIDVLGCWHLPLLGLTAPIFLASLCLWLMLQPKTLRLYLACMSACQRKLMCQKSLLTLRGEKVLAKINKLSLGTMTLFLSTLAASMIIPLAFLYAASGDFDLAWTVWGELLFISISFGFLVALFRLFKDVILEHKTALISLKASIKVQFILTLVVIFACFANAFTVGGNGLNQFSEQSFGHLENREKQKQIRLKALSYPDSHLANLAKLGAAEDLWLNFHALPDALALCNQVISSKHETDPLTLASAYQFRYKFRKFENPESNSSTDLEKAVSLLESAPQPTGIQPYLGVFNLYLPDRTPFISFEMAEEAIKMKNIGLAMRALTQAEKFKIGNFRSVNLRLQQLKSDLAKLLAAEKFRKSSHSSTQLSEP